MMTTSADDDDGQTVSIIDISFFHFILFIFTNFPKTRVQSAYTNFRKFQEEGWKFLKIFYAKS